MKDVGVFFFPCEHYWKQILKDLSQFRVRQNVDNFREKELGRWKKKKTTGNLEILE